MIEDKKVLCVITARAGSVGVPGKNYRLLCGYPLIYYSIVAALNSEHTDQILISSNCPHVAKAVVPFGYNTKVHFVQRPDYLSGPLHKNEGALIHAYYNCLNPVIGDYHMDADIIYNLQPTSPIRDKCLIDNAIIDMYDGEADSLLTVHRSAPFMWERVDGEPSANYDVRNRPMKQEIGEDDWLYFDNGNIYMMTREQLLGEMCRIGGKVLLYEVNEYENYQIDTDNDFNIVEAMMGQLDNLYVTPQDIEMALISF